MSKVWPGDLGEVKAASGSPPRGRAPITRQTSRRTHNSRRWMTRIGLGLAVLVPLGFLAVFFAYPVACLIGRGLVTDSQLDLSGFGEVLTRHRTWRIIGQTLGQATIATLLVIVAGLPVAHLLYRRRFLGRTVLRLWLTLPFVLPAVVVGVAFRSLLAGSGPLSGLELDGTMTAVVAALVFFNFGLFVRSVGLFWAQLDPRPLEVARSLGAGPVRALTTVTLPRLAPAVAAAGSLVFLFCATAFGVVLILGGVRYGTVETEIWIQTTQQLDLRAAAVLSLCQLVIVVLVLVGGAIARRRRDTRLRPAGPGAPTRLRRSDWPALALTVVAALFIAGPLLTLVIRSIRTPSGWSLANYGRLAEPGLAPGIPGSLLRAATRTITVAAQATVLSLVLGLLVAFILTRPVRSRLASRAAAVLDGVLMLPLGVSAVTVGFGFLIALNRPPLDLRTSTLLLPLAQAIVALPLVVRSILPAWRGVDPRSRQAAAVLGASPARVLLTVDAPIVLRATGVAAALAFAVSAGEFGATAFLWRPETATLPVAIYRLLSRPGATNFGTALAASVLLTLIAAVIMAVAERSRTPISGEF